MACTCRNFVFFPQKSQDDVEQLDAGDDDNLGEGDAMEDEEEEDDDGAADGVGAELGVGEGGGVAVVRPLLEGCNGSGRSFVPHAARSRH